MIAYHINGTTADRAEMNINQFRADELAAQGWLISAEPIVWAEKQYVGGDRSGGERGGAVAIQHPAGAGDQ